MKNRKLFLSAIYVSAISALTFFGSGCFGFIENGGDNSSQGSAQNPTVCVAPEVTATNEGFYWADVQGAASYQYKFNQTAWAKAEESVAFPTAAGEYTLYMKAIDAEGKEGRISETSFAVEVLTAACEQQDNTFVIDGTQIHYSVNGGEEAALSESKVLDFSSGTVGATYSVSYYAKGEFWSAENNTYYVSSAKKTASLTVMKALAAPALRVENNTLVWTAVENASSYAVTVDGESKSQTTCSVALPTVAGAHTITVQALGDSATNKPSQIATLSFTVKADQVPAVTYDKESGKVAWDSNYAEKMTIATDGENFLPATAATVDATDGLRLKLESYFDEGENVYYVNSKTISFVNRSLSALTFSADGYVSWNASDSAKAKTYGVSVVEESQASAYNLANNNVKNVASLSAGSYTMEVYASDYVEETQTEIRFYLPSETKSLAFKVLEKPDLAYVGNRILWTVDEYASAYEYKVSGETTWTTVPTDGYVEVSAMDTYEVRALGSGEEGKYSLTSSASSLLFDPTLEITQWETTLASFNNELYLQKITNATGGQATATGTREIITADNANEDEKAILAGSKDGGMLKVTAGNAKPLFVSHFGNGDGMNFYLFNSVKYDATNAIFFRVYIPSSEQRKNAWCYNSQGEYINAKDRTLDANGNVYAFFNGDTLVGYFGSSSNILLADGTALAKGSTLGEKTVESVKYDEKSTSMTVTFSDETTLTMARRAYGILDDNDVLLGVADETGTVKNGDVVVGTLNEKGELVNGETVLSTSAVKKTQNLDGNFCFGVEGTTASGTEYKDNWFRGTSALETGKWVEFSFPISAYSNMSEIVRVTARFCFSAREGDAFYIDEIRYGVMPPNAMPENMLYESTTGETIINPNGWRTEIDDADNWDGLITVTEDGIAYTNANKTNQHRLAPFIFTFDEGTKLEVGDQVVVTFERGETDKMTYQAYFNGDNATNPVGTYFLYSSTTQNTSGITYTVSKEMDLSTINLILWGNDTVGGRDITIKNVYIVKAGATEQ